MVTPSSLRFIVLICCCCSLLANSCSEGVKGGDGIETNIAIAPLDSLEVLPWVYDAEGDSMVFSMDMDSAQLSVTAIIHLLNQKYDGLIQLDFLKQSHDTVFVAIPDAQNLTQSMGTTGAFGYLSEVTYSLTEVPGVAAVNLQFEEGDHASPGVYTRKDFSNKILD